MNYIVKIFLVFSIFFFASVEKENTLFEVSETKESCVQTAFHSNDDAIQNLHSFEVSTSLISNFSLEKCSEYRITSFFVHTLHFKIWSSRIALLKIKFFSSIELFLTATTIIFPFHYFW